MSDDPSESTGRRILAVDDEPHILRVLTATFEKHGFSVVTAQDGTEALARLSERGVDLVMLDLMMPGTSGLEVLSVIRADPKHSGTPVIILTAKGQDTDREAAFAGGADDFMTKPFSPKKLLARVEEILAQR